LGDGSQSLRWAKPVFLKKAEADQAERTIRGS
jgi:hypothetical protein